MILNNRIRKIKRTDIFNYLVPRKRENIPDVDILLGDSSPVLFPPRIVFIAVSGNKEVDIDDEVVPPLTDLGPFSCLFTVGLIFANVPASRRF